MADEQIPQPAAEAKPPEKKVYHVQNIAREIDADQSGGIDRKELEELFRVTIEKSKKDPEEVIKTNLLQLGYDHHFIENVLKGKSNIPVADFQYKMNDFLAQKGKL